MTSGEQLSAYLAGELDAEDRAAVEAALEDDAQLRERLERLRRSEQALSALPAVEPPTGFSDELHAALDRELDDQATAGSGDELAARRRSRFEVLRPLGVAAAAAAVIALFGVAGVWLLQGGGGDSGEGAATTSMEAQGVNQVPIVETDNDYDEQQLQRVAVNAEIRTLVPQDFTAEEAQPLAERLQSDLLDRADDMAGAAQATEEDQGAEDSTGDTSADIQTFGTARREVSGTASVEAVGRCLSTVLQDARTPLVPVYVELARFKGTPAVIYTLVSEDPESGTYQRVEIWAVSPNDCQVLSFAQYDRS